MNSWQTKRLGEVVTIVGGGTPTRSNASFYGGEIPWVTPKDMKSWEITGAQVRITQSGLNNSATRLVPKNSILIVVRSGVLKHTIPVGLNRVPVAINQDMKALQCCDGVDADFLARFIKAQSSTILQWVRATTADNFPIDKLKNLHISLPPLAEQERIAEVLDCAEALRAKRRTTLAQFDSLMQSIFFALFGDPAANSMQWPVVRLGEHTSKIGSGATPKGGEKSYKTQGISLIRSLNVRDGEFSFKDLAFIDDEQAAKLSGVIVEADDVLLNITGASVARVCRAPSSVSPARVNQHVSIIRPNATLNAVFLEQFLLAPQIKHRLLRIGASGATREAITKAQIEEFEAICPPLELQRAFADKVKTIEKLKAQQRASLTELDALFVSLQHRAFRGEL